MDDFLAFAKPAIGDEEVAAATAVIRSGWLTTGSRCAEFERRFAEYVGVEHAVAVNSATAGLHLALEAAGVGPGDRVLTTPYTFTATAEVVRYLGADPVFVDIDPETLNIDADQVSIALEADPAISAIIPVHFAGQACEMDEIRSAASATGAVVIEDAAHAVPASYKGQMIGGLSDASVFSFYVTKTLATGEGGMVTTNRAELAQRMRTMRLHGISRDVFDRYQSTKPSWYYEVVAPGYKYNMTDVAAAIGIEQLKKAERLRVLRESIAVRYTAAFADAPVDFLEIRRPDDTHAWHLFVLQLRLAEINIDRDTFIERMADAGIGTSVHFIPLHLQPYWRDRYKLRKADFPLATEAYYRAVSLPIFPTMTDGEVQRVIDATLSILRAASL